MFSMAGIYHLITANRLTRQACEGWFFILLMVKFFLHFSLLVVVFIYLLLLFFNIIAPQLPLYTRGGKVSLQERCHFRLMATDRVVFWVNLWTPTFYFDHSSGYVVCTVLYYTHSVERDFVLGAVYSFSESWIVDRLMAFLWRQWLRKYVGVGSIVCLCVYGG